MPDRPARIDRALMPANLLSNVFDVAGDSIIVWWKKIAESFVVMEKAITMDNGTKVMTNGSYVTSDGTKKKMKNGDCIMKDGSVTTVDKMKM